MTFEEIIKKQEEVNGNMLKIKLGKRTIYVHGFIRKGSYYFDALQVDKEFGTLRYGKWGHRSEWRLNLDQVVDVLPIKCYLSHLR